MIYLDIVTLGLFALVGLVIVVILYFVTTYNRLQSLKNSANATLGQVRVALKKRLDMIEQLLGAVKSYATFEKETLERVIGMRAQIGTAGAGALSDVDRESRRLIGNIIAVAENYPTLRTSEHVTRLMEAIKSIEEEVARHRYTYNNIIQEFNTMLDTIPSKYVASSQGMVKMEYFKVEDEVERRPEIKF